MLCSNLRGSSLAIIVNTVLLMTILPPLPSWAQEQLLPDMQIWRGKLDTPNAVIRIRFEIEKKDGEYTGFLVSPDQGNTKLQIQAVDIAGDDFRLELRQPKATYVGRLDKSRTKLIGTWKQGDNELPLNMKLGKKDEAEPAAQETWVGEINAGIKLKVQVRVMKDPDTNEEVVYFDSLTQGVRGLKSTISKEDGKLVIEVPNVKGRFEGTLNENGTKAKGLWSQGFVKIPLELTKTDKAEEAREIKRPQHPHPPYGYKVEEVSFDSTDADVTLAGTLTLPEVADKKCMAAILISGSGPQDRDETIMGHKPFLVIADHLTKRGIAVLRFDDRGTGESSGNHDTATTQHFANDVRGAVAFLRSREEIDVDKIGLIGHSEGGLIGPLVTAGDHQLAFLVSLAGPGVNGEKIIINQSAAIARAAGESEANVELQQKQLPRIIKAIQQGADQDQIKKLAADFAKDVESQAVKDGDEDVPTGDDLEALLMGGFDRMQTPWFRFVLTYEPIPALEKTTCPILSLIGEKDLQVDPKLNMEPLQAALKRAGNPKSKCLELPGLNHLFQECETGALDEYQTIEQTFAPSALNQISDWLQSLD